MKLNFIFNSEPKAIQSVRVANVGGYVRTYQPKANKDWKNWIKMQAELQRPEDFKIIGDAVRITKLHFIFKPLKKFSKYKLNFIKNGGIIYKTTQPDLIDNLNKGFIDALTGIIWANDSLIVAVNNVAKYYGFKPRIELEIHTIN
jgi:Holliday junction resolvase RusA-like endonuclease